MVKFQAAEINRAEGLHRSWWLRAGEGSRALKTTVAYTKADKSSYSGHRLAGFDEAYSALLTSMSSCKKRSLGKPYGPNLNLGRNHFIVNPGR